MHISSNSRRFFLTCFFIDMLFASAAPGLANENGWVNLFNGKDLIDWETWLHAPEDQGGEEGEPIGLNKDPLGAFTMKDGEMKDGEIRVSGQVFGCISSVEQFSDYQVHFDF